MNARDSTKLLLTSYYCERILYEMKLMQNFLSHPKSWLNLMPTQAQSYKLVAITTIISLSQLEAANSHSRTITLTRAGRRAHTITWCPV
jgi:hypothetical protein